MDPAAFADALASAQRGEEDGFAWIWRAFQPPLLRFIRGSAGPQLADDVAAQVWVEVVRSLGRFEGDERGFRSWLFTIGRLRLIDARREARRKPTTSMAEPPEPTTHQVDHRDPGDLAAERWSTAEAVDLIGMLAPDQAEVVLLRVVGELSNREVAEVVGKSEGAVRVLAHRGLKRLARLIDADDPSRLGVTG